MNGHKFQLAVLLAAVLFGMTSTGALAYNGWSQLINAYDSGGTNLCGSNREEPCLYWKEPHWTSITINAFEDPSLRTLSGASGSYDMTTPLSNVFTDFNSVPYYFPYIHKCSTNTLGCGPISYTTSGALPCGALAATTLGSYSTPENNGRAYAFFPTGGDSREVIVNSLVTWNNSLYDNYVSCTNSSADGQEVTDHETGHVMSLGHTGNHAAIMYPYVQGLYKTLQANDKSGLASIYPGNQPDK